VQEAPLKRLAACESRAANCGVKYEVFL